MSWTSAIAVADSRLAAIYDETDCTARPRASNVSPNAPDVDDTSRTPFAFRGTIERGSMALPRGGSGPSDPGASAGRGIAHPAVLTAHAKNWPWRPKRFDRIDADGKTWRIENVESDGGARFVAWLSEAS